MSRNLVRILEGREVRFLAALHNRALVADAAESAFCEFTSGAALAGLGLNAWLGWWWDVMTLRWQPLLEVGIASAVGRGPVRRG
jgi:hypothetical protein